MKDREAKIQENLGLVHTCANRLRGRGIAYEDLYQAGCLGLVKAVDGFDPARGLQFSTYAVPVILGEIRRLFRDGGAIKVGRALKERALKASRCIADFTAQEGRAPTIEELAQILGIEPAEAAEAVRAGQRPISLSVDAEHGGELEVAVESETEKIGELLALRQVVGELEQKDRRLLLLRYVQQETQAKTGAVLGMTQVQVSRREKKILAELKRKLDA